MGHLDGRVVVIAGAVFGSSVALFFVFPRVGLGFFAPKVEHALSGAGWEASGSESVAAREVVDRDFGGFGGYGLMVVVASDTQNASSPEF